MHVLMQNYTNTALKSQYWIGGVQIDGLDAPLPSPLWGCRRRRSHARPARCRRHSLGGRLTGDTAPPPRVGQTTQGVAASPVRRPPRRLIDIIPSQDYSRVSTGSVLDRRSSIIVSDRYRPIFIYKISYRIVSGLIRIVLSLVCNACF